MTFEHGDKIETVEQLISELAWSRYGMEISPEEIKKEREEVAEEE